MITTGNKDDFNLTIVGREDARNLKEFDFIASLVFFDDSFNKGACCVSQTNNTNKSINNIYNIVIIELDNYTNKWIICSKLIENLEEQAITIFYLNSFNKTNVKKNTWLVVVTVSVSFFNIKNIFNAA